MGTLPYKQSTLYLCSLKVLGELGSLIRETMLWQYTYKEPREQRVGSYQRYAHLSRERIGTHCDFDVIEAGKRCPNRLSSEGLLSTKIINNSLSLNILNVLQTVFTHITKDRPSHFSSIHMPTFRSNTMWRSFQTY